MVKYSELLKKRAMEKNKAVIAVKEDPDYVKKEKSLNFVVKDGFFTSIKNGFTSSFLMPFAIALNASTGMLTALSSVPQLVAAFFQLFSQESLAFFKTRKNNIVWTALLQALMWIPLLIIPFFARQQIWLIILFATLEATFGTFQGPIYNSILGDIIPEDKRGEFFGKRNAVVNLMSFISTLVAGFVLSYFKSLDNGTAHYIFFGFAILFAIAFICRSIAAYYKSKITEPEFKPSIKKNSFIKFVSHMTKDNYGIFVIYVFLFQMAASITAPFFALYLLHDMHLNYIYFTLVMGASIISSFIFMSFWGKQIDKHGSKRVLTIAGFLVPLSPFLLVLAIFIRNPIWIFIYLFVEEAFSGIVWSAFNLSTSSFLYDATSKDDRIKYVAYYNFLVGIAIFVGAVIGGLLIHIYPVWVVSAIPILYLTTGILRLIVTSIMIKRVREARMVEVDFPGRGFFHQVVSISPHYGSTVEIVGVYHPKTFSKVVLPIKRSPIDPVKIDERKLYEKKSFEYYRENAMKTLAQKDKQFTPKDDSDKIEKHIEQEKKKIADITENIRRDQAKK